MNQVELPAGFGQTRGSEHEVWFSKDGRAIKATHPGEYGRLFGPDRFATLEQYLERIRLTVDLFGLDWRIHGIHGFERNVRVVTSQPIFLGKPATRQEITEFMKKRRFVFHRTRFGDAWYRHEDNVLVADAEPKNVVHGVEGLAPIDVIVCRPSAELLKAANI
ncbi:putative polyvalent protein kinase domain-containing protein [Prosthecobacter debontii]|uniref:putative polyvalent protein kinase domain-containing protein n=1 Tax=Prosthecobacter debontii TaxID=48467 RepID=UPI0011176557|nr:hypothetical protein [Prosthecobacter debontii]